MSIKKIGQTADRAVEFVEEKVKEELQPVNLALTAAGPAGRVAKAIVKGARPILDDVSGQDSKGRWEGDVVGREPTAEVRQAMAGGLEPTCPCGCGARDPRQCPTWQERLAEQAQRS